MDLDAFEKHLVWAEAEKLFPYRCSAGKLTIGVGRNLDDRGITKEESRFLLANDIAIVLKDCSNLDYWDLLDPVRQLVVADMVFNLGYSRFLQFVTLAAHEMKDSRWYDQVGRRAWKLHAAMLSGDWDE